MKNLIMGGFLVAAIINLLPVVGVVGVPRRERMHGSAK